MNIVDTLYYMIEDGRSGKNLGMPTGIPKLDQRTGGMRKKCYTLVFGLSGSGKTSVVLYSNIYRPLKDNPDKDIVIVYYSLEMGAEILLAKLLCLYIYEEFGVVITYDQVMSWKEILNEELYDYVKKSKDWLKSIGNKLIIFDKPLTSKSFWASMSSLMENYGKFEEVDDGNRKIYIPKDPEKQIYVVLDHLGLVKPSEGRDKKREIDEVSSYMVWFRNKCGVSFFALMQQNRDSLQMERRKADMLEPSSNDLKDSGNPYNDCDICIGVYNPLEQKQKKCHGYTIIIEKERSTPGEFLGMRDRFRSLILIKNRYGEPNYAIDLNFFGEIGMFKELPSSKDITNYSPYMSLKYENIKEDKKEDSEQKDQNNQQIIFTF